MPEPMAPSFAAQLNVIELTAVIKGWVELSTVVAPSEAVKLVITEAVRSMEKFRSSCAGAKGILKASILTPHWSPPSMEHQPGTWMGGETPPITQTMFPRLSQK